MSSFLIQKTVVKWRPLAKIFLKDRIEEEGNKAAIAILAEGLGILKNSTWGWEKSEGKSAQ